ncbi:hypothetical protein Q5P01_019077 [Channa striata]|uniref:hexokinase n=1 Tax=Channa striata TaxID=64152 RepID=A0AA88SB79_CHASR|nr:hypothetical protein Q5P01_019077 [Channa striata]
MRGRRGKTSSSVKAYWKQTRMSLRKHQRDENAQEDGAIDDRDDEDEFSSSLLAAESARDRRRRERENKSKPKEMSEEQMMDLALRLSEQEASITASRLQQEEEAMKKAVQESMGSQTQLCPASQSQSLLVAEASPRLCSRRKLLYSHGKRAPAIDQGALELNCPSDADLNQENRDENNTRNKKQDRKEGSPLPEMPDLSQTQNIYSQTSPHNSESSSVPLDSPQSCDSTQIDDCQLRKSPVFPLTGHKAKVYIPRLSQELLETCKTTGFVLCSQDSWTSTQKSLPAQHKSPTFPKSPSDLTACPKSPVFSETDQGNDEKTELSPVFGRNTQNEKSPSACKSHLCENAGFMLSSQESLTSSVRCTAHKSPVFPKSPILSKDLTSLERTAACKSPVFSEDTKSYACATSPVFSRTGRPQQIDPNVKMSSVELSTAKLSSSNGGSNSPTIADPSQSPNQNGKTDAKITTSSKSDDAQMLNDLSKDSNFTETDLTSDMMLVWSDEEVDNVTPVGSPSPVFPEESHQNRTTAGAPEKAEPSCIQQFAPTERESQPVSSQGTVRRPSAPFRESAGGPTVYYYWGVPFCPQGLDPDNYTQVILAQMEVYEKSLKQAQRCLLRKAEWGEPILPQPEKSPSPESPAESPQHHIPRSLRLRGKRHCEAADTSPAETEEGEDQHEEEKEHKEEEEEKKKRENGEERQLDTDDCDVCPETQLSDSDSTQDLTMVTDDGKQPQRENRALPEIEMILRGGSPAVDQVEDGMEVDSQVDLQTKWSFHVRKEKYEENGRDQDVEEVKDQGPQRWATTELEPAAVPQSPESALDCPICQRSFPVAEIEIHAAYCDGEVVVVDESRPKPDSFQTSSKPQRKRTRRADVTDEETDGCCNTSRNQEKCYVCQKAVPLRDYNQHTELCIQRQVSKTDAKGNLLSALEQTESRDSEAGPSRLQPGEVIDLRDDEDDDDSVTRQCLGSVTLPSGPSLQSQRPPTALSTSKSSSEPRSRAGDDDEDDLLQRGDKHLLRVERPRKDVGGFYLTSVLRICASSPVSFSDKAQDAKMNITEAKVENCPINREKLNKVLMPFQLSPEKLQEISARLKKDLIRGLGKHTHNKAPVKMLPTFVRATPDGTEKGDFLALDLGGTNFRVMYVRVVEQEQEQNELKVDSEICAIPQEVMLGPGEQLFDHIATCLGNFLDSKKLKGQTLPLGFTFSFPCEQKEIDKSILIHWTKGFNCSGVEGKDVVKLLKEAIRRRGDYDIGSVAMVNDTVGTMMSCGYKDQRCEIGMIIGTGTNACYMEEMNNVERVEGEDGRMCINTEWGGFGDDGSLKDVQTEFDVKVDKTSINPGVHIFEKMISGMYLGEIVRLLLVKLTQDQLLFKGQTSEALTTPGRFETKFISEIEETDTGLKTTQDILTGLGLTWDDDDVHVVRLVCDTLSSRSAHLCAAALATLANRIRENRGLDHLKTTVGVDGTVFRKHPKFSKKLKEMVRLLAPECDITFLVSEDGSGKGAAMVTAVAQRLALQSRLLEDDEEEDK